MTFSVSQATKVALAGTLALTGVLGASFVGVSQGETTLNQAQAAEVNQVDSVDGVTDISFTKQQNQLQTHRTFDAQLNFTITEDIGHGVFKALRFEGKTQTDKGEKDALYINGRANVEVDGEVIGEQIGKRIVFNENVLNHVGKEVTVNMKPGITPSILAGTKGEHDLPVHFKLNNQVVGQDNYKVNVTKTVTNTNLINNAHKRGLALGTIVGKVDAQNNYTFNNTVNIGAEFFQTNDTLTLTVKVPEGVEISNIPDVGEDLDLLHGSVGKYDNGINGTELTFFEEDQYVFNLNINRVSEDTVVYTYAKNSKFTDEVKGGIPLKSIYYSVDEGTYSTEDAGNWLKGKLDENITITSPEADYNRVISGSNIKK